MSSQDVSLFHGLIRSLVLGMLRTSAESMVTRTIALDVLAKARRAGVEGDLIDVLGEALS